MSVRIRRMKNRLGFRMRMGRRRGMRNTKRRTGNPKKFFLLAMVAALICYFLYIYLFQFRPILFTMAKTQANSLAIQAVNSSVSDVMKDTSYEDLISLMKGDGEKVTAVVSNIVAMNRLKSQLVIAIDQNIQKIDHFGVRIPLGNVLGIDVLSGMGPRMQIGVLSDGLTRVDFINLFDAAGINQTRHQIQLKVDTTIHIMIPNSNPISATVTTQIPIAETVIVGDVPNSYTNLETQESMIRDDILELQ
ncbi:sporulation protein YunB [Acetivibrio sp. MSJd-27]|uniref:sporulation protein YunB n=1 Tax=Acetivibrio sp. MSJd-27 TaxID=2841523 RepID=UPI001C0F420E|nr:sporulation protein YunB [Acetivibrio sp. MSJd-27]MBU5451075.1 sporulation protein YunB [Acetivibrio sp. MSJd-27]